jgi:kynurenine formamidase
VPGRSILAGAVLGLCGACSFGPKEPEPPPALSDVELVDLTHSFDAQTVAWPTSPSSFTLTQLSAGMTEGGWYYAANSLCTPEHAGTHLDAPRHFAEGGWTTEQIPLDRLFGPCVVIDIVSRAARDPDYVLTLADVKTFEARHGEVPEGTVVLLRTGWSKRWPDAALYLGDDTPGDASHLHFPSFGVEAARYLIEERGIVALGVDTASIDPGNSRDFPVHRLCGEQNVSGLENVTRLDRVPATGAWVLALPMKIRGGSGGPTRIVALLPD